MTARSAPPTDDLGQPPAIESDSPGGVAPPGEFLATTLAPLVGRTRERAVVRDLLRNPEVRLLVLTGPGGVGKTRLAISVAQHAHDAFRDGVWFVDLAPILHPELVLPTIASALGVRHNSTVPLLDSINSMLRQRDILLVVDNFEHVADEARLLTDLLMANPGLTILVTSRSVLSVYGEHVYPVPPMAVPLIPEREIGREGVAATIASADAVKLFVKRATAARGDFRLTDDNAGDVLSICRLLDGLPLAIELAAARISILSPKMLARRLHTRLPMLDDGPHNVPARLRTMRNAISWSYGLLNPRERAIFRRISVFAGSWTIDEAHAVASIAGEHEQPTELDTIDLISSLVDKSLLRQVESTSASPHFGMLQTLREFGLEQLERSAELDEIEELHALHMLRVAESAHPELTGPNQIAWLDRLANMHPDFLIAFSWLVRHDPPERCLRLATALWRFGYTRGHIREGREWLERALERNPQRTALRGTALNGAGVLANMEGNLEATRELHEEALAIGHELGDQRVVALARLGLGDVAATQQQSADALAHYGAVEKIFRELGDQRGIAATRTNLGNLLWAMNRLSEAVNTHERAKVLYQASGDQRGIAWSVTNIGRIAAQQGAFERAVGNLSQALALYDQLGDRGGYAESLEGIAQVAIGARDYDRALTMLAAADGLREAVEHPIAPLDRDAYDRMLVEVRAAFGDEFDEIWEADRAMAFDEIKQVAAAFLSDSPLPPRAAPRAVRKHDASMLVRELGISEREIEVLALVAAGKTDKDIGEELFISVRTVQSHVANLLTKLEVNARSAAVARALRSGIIT